MAITDEDIKAQIVLEVGDVDPENGDPPVPPSTGIVASRIDYLWERFSGWGMPLQELYCRQSAIRLVLGVLAPRRFDSTDTRGGLSLRAHQLVDSYQAMLEATTEEIVLVKKSAGGAAGSGAYRGRRLLTTAPVTAPSPPDPNALRYGGTVRGLEPCPPSDDPRLQEP